MKSSLDSSTIKKVILNKGERLVLRTDGDVQLSTTCDEIARLALAIHDKAHFFSLRRSLKTRFSRDINGSGVQLLEVAREEDDFSAGYLVHVVFEPGYPDDEDFLYEADLIRDQGKDYEPTVNHGKFRFVAKSAWLQINWGCDEVTQWGSDVKRLAATPTSLVGWIEAGLEMLVRCSSGALCGQKSVFTNDDLARFVAAGLCLEALKERLTCSKCGKRKARLLVL